jgi:hypothetical protein
MMVEDEPGFHVPESSSFPLKLVQEPHNPKARRRRANDLSEGL